MTTQHDKELRVLQNILDHMLTVQRILSDRAGTAARRAFICLALNPQLSIGEIAKCIHVSDSIASRAVSCLSDLDLVRVVIDPESRRRHLVQLTPAGILKASEIAKHALAGHHKIHKEL